MFDAFAKAWSSSANNNSGNPTRTTPAAGAKNKSTASPSVLRDDLYKAIAEAERWLATSTPGDTYSYRPTHAILYPHYPELEVPYGCGTEEEVGIIVAGVTNMAMEVGWLDSLTGVVVMRSWTDALEGVIKSWKAKESSNPAGKRICEAIVLGVNHRSDTTLLAKELAPRIQIIGMLKGIAQAVYGKTAGETRQSDALWGSRLVAM